MKMRNMIIEDYEEVYKLWTNTSGMGVRSLDDSKEGVCESLKKEGITKVSLVVFSTNELGKTFWKSIGFEERIDLDYFNQSLNHENE